LAKSYEVSDAVTTVPFGAVYTVEVSVPPDKLIGAARIKFKVCDLDATCNPSVAVILKTALPIVDTFPNVCKVYTPLDSVTD
jgi:hypothetical protein